ncbi:MAG: adenylosuccinate synthetase, partial [Myxococcota bacterium]
MAAQRHAWVVVDLGFGDAGKGTTVDWLARDRPVHTVIRFNGGAQAGHNVVTPDGRHHCFAQLGAGSFMPGVDTYLSSTVVVHPTALLLEAERFGGGVLDSVHISPHALLTTPVHQVLCRLREMVRGETAHGTTGVGVGETMRVSLERPELALRIADLRDPRRLHRRLDRLREYGRALASELTAPARPEHHGRMVAEASCLEDDAFWRRWLKRAVRLVTRIAPEGYESELLSRPGDIVFEGAQGVLLDEWRGFHPHTTWSTCTSAHADEMLRAYDGEVTRWGVLRSYATRHGQGPFPTECDACSRLSEPHNGASGWQ